MSDGHLACFSKVLRLMVLIDVLDNLVLDSPEESTEKLIEWMWQSNKNCKKIRMETQHFLRGILENYQCCRSCHCEINSSTLRYDFATKIT